MSKLTYAKSSQEKFPFPYLADSHFTIFIHIDLYLYIRYLSNWFSFNVVIVYHPKFNSISSYKVLLFSKLSCLFTL